MLHGRHVQAQNSGERKYQPKKIEHDFHYRIDVTRANDIICGFLLCSTFHIKAPIAMCGIS